MVYVSEMELNAGAELWSKRMRPYLILFFCSFGELLFSDSVAKIAFNFIETITRWNFKTHFPLLAVTSRHNLSEKPLTQPHA